MMPMNFRQAFEQEMNQVFMMGSDQAHKKNRFPFLFYYREIRDLPTLIIREHRITIFEKVRNSLNQRTNTSFYLQKEQHEMSHSRNDSRSFDVDRREIIIASLPPVVLGLGITTSSLITGKPWYDLPQWRLTLAVAILLVAGGAISCGAIYALVRRIPDWGYSWIASAFLGAVLFIQAILGELNDEGKLLITDEMEVVLAVFFLLIGFIVLLLASWRGWHRAGLFSLGLASTFVLALWQAVVAAPFNRHDIAVFALPLGLLFASLIYLYIRGTDPVRVLVIIGVTVLSVLAIFIATTAWESWLQNASKASPILPLIAILIFLLVAGPIAAGILRPIRSHHKKSNS